jgi:multidrug efflux system outer membrane protein
MNRAGEFLPLRKKRVPETGWFESGEKSPAMSGFFWGLLLLVFLGQALSSCAPFAPAARSPQEVALLPASYSIKEAISEPQQRWWETFGDDELNGFIDEALSGNQDLALYWARLGKANALAAKAGADFIPSASGEAGGSYARSRRAEDSSGQTTENNNYNLGLVASYEVDIWGRIRAAAQSANLSATASRQDLNGAAITIAAEVAERWARIISQRQQKSLLQRQLAVNETYLDLVELRFRKSLASALDVMQQKQLVERVKAQMPLIDMEESLLLNELAVLLGRQPYNGPPFEGHTLPELDAPPAAGIPAQLLEFRPDILSAYYRLSAADQNLAAARADRLPALRLTGGAAYSSDALEGIFDNWLLNLAAGLTAPLIDGGRRKAEVSYAESGVQEQLAAYRQTVLIAVREVESALIREEKIRENITGIENQLQAAQTALSEAGFRYTNGLIDYLPVLTQLLSVQNLEFDLIARRTELLIARMNLYRAIGGTWTDALAPPAQEKISKTGYKKNA